MADQVNYNQRSTASHAKTLGITQHATPLRAPWTGDLRVRFSDFQVNEIGPDGKVYRLTSMGLSDEQRGGNAENTPVGAGANKKAEKTEENGAEGQPPAEEEPKPAEETPEIAVEDIAQLENLAGSEFAQQLVQLCEQNPVADEGKPKPKPKPVTSEPLTDRSKRGEIHQAIRRIFKGRVDTSTADSGAIVATLMTARNKQKRGRRDRNERSQGEERPAGEYIHFTLYKDNRDTMDAVNQVARILKVKPQTIGYAGTKDRRASTVQRCSLRYARLRGLAATNGKLWGVATGDYEFKNEGIHLGQLRGNEFAITIKNCELAEGQSSLPAAEKLEIMKPQVQSALDHMAEHGWINYFGHQRFGTHEFGTHEIGRLLLGDNCEEAVNSLLSYDADIAERAENGEIPDEPSKKDSFLRNQACMLYKSGKDINRALEIMPRRFAAEVSIIRHLTKQGSNDFVGAITSITRNLRSMYLHAYQSHTWNHAASKRWELHGAKVVEGDLVIEENSTAPARQDHDGNDIINPNDAEDDDSGPVRARALTAEDIASGRFTIKDVVLPSPGHDVIYPTNEIGAFYTEFMGREENGALDPHNMKRMRREFSLPGRYRKLMNHFLAPPSIEFKLYSDDTEQMHPTDMDRIKAARTHTNPKKHARTDSHSEPLAKRTKGEDGETVSNEDGKAALEGVDAGEDSRDAEPVADGEAAPAAEAEEPTKIAAVVKFQLGSSAYATVTLRELMGDAPE